MLALYHWEPNANSGKPMLALAEKGVAWESHYIDLLRFDQHQSSYLAINPDGTIPTLVHDGRVLTESTPAMEYIDAQLPGPALRPADAQGRWRMRWWMRFFDAYFGPSLSMIGWSIFVGPAVRMRDRRELEEAIGRIPLPARRLAWRKAMFNEFTGAELAESRRRVLFAIDVLEEHLGRHPWVAGPGYSLADISGFNLGYALPLSQPQACNDDRTPRIMEWLRRIYERPATRQIWAMGRTQMVGRVRFLERS